MENRKRRPPNIDGFYNDQPRRRAIGRQNQKDPLSPITGNTPVGRHQVSNNINRKTRLVSSYAIARKGRSSSLLNASLPNSSYSLSSNSLIQESINKDKKSKLVKKKWSRKRKTLTTLLTIVVIFLGLTGWFGSKIISSLDKVFHGNIFTDAQALFGQSNLKESNGRVNILVAGDSTDQPNHPGAILTDSIMVLSYNPSNHTGFMLSIPRDLWVYIPGLHSYQKINASVDVTNFKAAGYPNGGVGQLEQIIQTDLGIPIDYYAIVNYAAVKDSVNAVGGVTINIHSPDPRGIYDAYTHLNLPNGQDHLNGQQALDLSRARGDTAAGDVSYGIPNSDFTRTMYQREIVGAILKKAMTVGVLSNPIKITSLFNAFSNNVTTDLKIQSILSLVKDVRSMNISKIGSHTYSNSLSGDPSPLLIDYTDPSSGQEALIPSEGIGNYGGLKAYFQSLSSNNPLTKENASVEILNGTNVSGLAKKAQQSLQAKGVSNVSIGNAVYSNYTTSMVVNNVGAKDSATSTLLQQMFPGSEVSHSNGTVESKEATKYNDNFVVILGQNYVTNLGSSTN